MSKACHNFEIPHAIEISRSGNGAHLWIFFSEKVPAREARFLGFGLLDKAMEFYPNNKNKAKRHEHSSLWAENVVDSAIKSVVVEALPAHGFL